jgi:hypothetical protein
MHPHFNPAAPRWLRFSREDDEHSFQGAPRGASILLRCHLALTDLYGNAVSIAGLRDCVRQRLAKEK